ncbi:aspartyl-tRNA synthetase, archaeal type [Aciduliprofundum sp. MAR08-339]|uniref:aspartate--tRNA(Asn) ligase n=1 Tax=Aciduliprofundum sp. (strain MAR08-339) TaxID=673860 RepID=UPI0002A4CDD4|nr:aspartyl-tRNA synthetase, archaeal type [Aciduliprofundum sp. MAR08-339]
MLRTHTLKEASQLDGVEVKVCGWIHDIRVLGRIAFIILRDRSGFAQLTLIRGILGKEKFKEYTKLTRETVICARGKVQRTDQAKLGFEILPEEIEVLSVAETPLPLGVADKVSADMETRIENRFLDLRKPEVLSVFKVRSAILQGIRDTLISKNFLEVHTPKIVATATEGGTELFPVRYFEKEAYLNQSPQLYKQILMAAGFDRVFEIAPAFRAEEHNTTRHLNEFISIDVEISFADDEDAMRVLEESIANGIKYAVENEREALELLGMKWKEPELPFKRITYDEALSIINKNMDMEWGEDFSTEALKVLGEEIKDFYFITQWPLEIKPFYVMPYDEKYSLAFDLMYREKELSSGAQRNHRYESLVEIMKGKGLNPENFEFYLRAFRYGMPPHAGWGLGLERLVMIITGVKNIRECVIFPRDRTRLVP